MRLEKFGSTGRGVSVIGQGTWDLERADRKPAIAALQRGVELGMTHIDTAEYYGAGRVEEIVGEAIVDRREQVFLVSKVCPNHGTYAQTLKACEDSLKRLRTDRLDVYLLHWRGRADLVGVFKAFLDLQRQGKILHAGVSNFDVHDLEDMRAIEGGQAMVCNQVLYHLEERTIENAVLPWCIDHHLAVTAYSPFGHDRFPTPHSPHGKVLQAIADAHGATPRQVALQFLVHDPHVFAIPKASSVAHTEENAAAVDLRLTAEDFAWLEKTFPKPHLTTALPSL